jgi:hypothetical protein
MNKENKPQRKERADRKTIRSDITRAKFHKLVRKSAQPIKQPTESDSASSETLESRHSDDYNGTNTR